MSSTRRSYVRKRPRVRALRIMANIQPEQLAHIVSNLPDGTTRAWIGIVGTGKVPNVQAEVGGKIVCYHGSSMAPWGGKATRFNPSNVVEIHPLTGQSLEV